MNKYGIKVPVNDVNKNKVYKSRNDLYDAGWLIREEKDLTSPFKGI